MPAETPATPALSPREREVMERAARGLTDVAIGQELNISEHTVDSTIRRVFAKLKVNSRAAAVAKLMLAPEDKRQLSLFGI